MKRYLFVLIPAILLAGLIAWRFSVANAQKAQLAKTTAARKHAAASVAVATAQVKDLVYTYEAVGSVQSPFDVKIASYITGRITYLQVRPGDRVTKGEVLARIDPSEIEATVAQDQANVAQAQQRLAQA